MSPTLTALIGFAGWTVLLATATLLYRTGMVLARKRLANAWPRGTTPEGEPALMVRVRDAHLNCAENLPVFAAIVIVAGVADRLAATDQVALYVLAARVAQSFTHLLGTSHWHVFVRANFFAIQLGLYVYMILSLLAP